MHRFNRVSLGRVETMSLKVFKPVFLLLNMCWWLSACESTHAPAPVANGWAHVNSTQRVYVVQPGDTIYSIAWKFAKNYQRLAAANHLIAPYTVTPGQSLQLTRSQQDKKAVQAKVLVKTEVLIKTKESSALVNKAPESVKANGHFPWPLKGTVVANFGQNGCKGLDILVPIGTPVKAIDSGTVVYAGDNLHGYGQLLIIKHEHDLMTAYAHNSTLLVQEGGLVTAGQVIALSGDSEATKPMLHFEVRQAGHPVNPAHFLT